VIFKYCMVFTEINCSSINWSRFLWIHYVFCNNIFNKMYVWWTYKYVVYI